MDLRLKKVRSPGWWRGGTLPYLSKAGMCLLVIVFRVLSLKKGPQAPLPKASLSAPSPRTIYILIHLSEILNNQQFFKLFVKDTFHYLATHITKLILSLFVCCRCCNYSCEAGFFEIIYILEEYDNKRQCENFGGHKWECVILLRQFRSIKSSCV